MAIDNLSLVVDLLILVAVAVFYTGFMVFFNYWRKDLDRAQAALREGATLLLILAAVVGIIGLWGEMTFPLFGSYNTLFFDPLVMLAIMIGSFGLAVWLRLPTHFVGALGVVIGSGVIYYGARAYQLPLTQNPLETFLLYLAFGALAIGTLIPTLFVDWYIVGPKNPNVQPTASPPTPEYPGLWTVLLSGYLGVTFLAGLAALFYGFSIAWAHLS